MKNKIIISNFQFLISILLSFCLSPAYAQPEATIAVTVSLASTNKPSLGMASASNIMAETAYLGGSVTATNGYPVSERGIGWGTNSGTVRADGTNYSESGTFAAGDFSFWVTNLPSGRTNYFLAYAVNSQGTNFTAESSFLTRPAAPGILPPTNITANALYANWLPAESSAAYLLDVAMTNDFAEYLAGYSNRMAGAELTCAVTGLQTRGVYYYRVRSGNATGLSTNSRVMTVSKGAIGLLPASLSYTGVYGGPNPAAQSCVVTNSGYWDFAFTNSAGYSAGAADWWRATPATGGLASVSSLAITGDVDITGLNAGTYYVTNAVISAEATNSPQYLVTMLTVDKANQAITNFTPASGSVFAVTNTTELNAPGGGSMNPVLFTVISGPGVISELTHLAFTNSGTVSVTANQSGDTNWNAAPAVTSMYSVLSADMLGQTITNFMSINGSEFEVTSEVGLSAQATSLLRVSFVVKSGPGLITGGTNLVFTATGLVSIVASQAGNTFYDAAPNMTNTFNVATPLPAAPGWLAVRVTPIGGSWQLTAPAGYIGPDAGPGNLAAVSAVVGEYGITYGALSGYAAPTNQTQFVIVGVTSLFAGVYLQISTADITASDMVYLPVNATNLSPAGTVSFWLGNLGPDILNSAEVVFDFRMGIDDASMMMLGSDQRAFSLLAGQEQLVILTEQAKRGLVVPATLGGVNQVQVTVRHAGTLIDPNITNNTTTAPGTVLVRAAGVNSPGRSVNDYDGDGKSDLALALSDKSTWWTLLSGTRNRNVSGINVNTADGRYWTTAGDYDGDGLMDYGLYEENSGT